MARRALVDAISEGEQAPAHEKPLDKLDTPEHQEEIIQPSHTEFSTVDGQTFYLPHDFTLRDVYQTRVQLSLMAFTSIFRYELEKLNIDLTQAVSYNGMSAAMLKESVQDAMAELLHIVLKRPKADFQWTLDVNAIATVFGWTSRMLKQSADGASNEKN